MEGGNINCTYECESVGVCWNHTPHIQTHTILDGVVDRRNWCHSCYVCIHVCVRGRYSVCVSVTKCILVQWFNPTWRLWLGRRRRLPHQ